MKPLVGRALVPFLARITRKLDRWANPHKEKNIDDFISAFEAPELPLSEYLAQWWERSHAELAAWSITHPPEDD